MENIMYTRLLCVSANQCFDASDDQNSGLYKMLGELAEACKSDGRKIISSSSKDGKKYFSAGNYCGFACLTDGTLIEILPTAKGGAAEARKLLCAEFCRRCGAVFDASGFDPDMNFMEYLISVFAGETMKIIKSGVLSAYASIEENVTSVQGTILFSENNRRNLVHRERIYVRHEVFTSDRAENRIIKAAATIFNKNTANSHSSHLLKEALSFLDDVRKIYDVKAEFSKCINARNTKKYNTVLSICRMIFDKDEGTAFTAKNISCAQFYEMMPQEQKHKVKVVPVSKRERA